MLNKNVPIIYFTISSSCNYLVVAQWYTEVRDWNNCIAYSEFLPKGTGNSEQEAKQNLIQATRKFYNVK